MKRELDEKEQEAARNNKREKIEEEKMDPKQALQWFVRFPKWFFLVLLKWFVRLMQNDPDKKVKIEKGESNESSSSSSESESSDEEDEEDLLRELEKIKKERAQEAEMRQRFGRKEGCVCVC